MTDLVVGDFGVNLCGGDVFVSEHLADRLQGNTLREGDRGRKSVPSLMQHGYCLRIRVVGPK